MDGERPRYTFLLRPVDCPRPGKVRHSLQVRRYISISGPRPLNEEAWSRESSDPDAVDSEDVDPAAGRDLPEREGGDGGGARRRNRRGGGGGGGDGGGDEGGAGGAERGIVPLGTCIRGGKRFRRSLEQFRRRRRQGRVIDSEESEGDAEEIEGQVTCAQDHGNVLSSAGVIEREESSNSGSPESQTQDPRRSCPEDQVLSTQAHHLLVEISRALASIASGHLSSQLVRLLDAISGRAVDGRASNIQSTMAVDSLENIFERCSILDNNITIFSFVQMLNFIQLRNKVFR